MKGGKRDRYMIKVKKKEKRKSSMIKVKKEYRKS